MVIPQWSLKKELRDSNTLEQQVWIPQTQNGCREQDLIKVWGRILSGLEFPQRLVLCTLTKIYDYVTSKAMYSLMFLLHPI